MSTDLYQTLGVNQNANPDDIKKSYRKLSMKYHPDKNQGNEQAAEKFKEISNAYSILSDKEAKAKYDMEKQFNNGNVNLNDIFSSIFGGAGPPGMHGMSGMHGMPPFMGFPGGTSFRVVSGNNPFSGMHQEGGYRFQPNVNMLNKPPPITKKISISMKQAFTGCNIPIQITRWCKNSNEKREETETLYIKIPRGIDDSEIIIIRDKGHNNNSLKGDIKIYIRINNNSDLERKGLDLIFKQTITLKEALCGVSFDLPHIDGKTYKINNDMGSIIQPGYRKIIPNMGFVRDDIKGSLIIEFTVNFPDKISKSNIDKLKNIL